MDILKQHFLALDILMNITLLPLAQEATTTLISYPVGSDVHVRSTGQNQQIPRSPDSQPTTLPHAFTGGCHCSIATPQFFTLWPQTYLLMAHLLRVTAKREKLFPGVWS